MIPLDCFSRRPVEQSLTPLERREAHSEGGSLTEDMERLRVRAYKALRKAAKVKPAVRKLLWLNQPVRRYYSVMGTTTEYLVTLIQDRDERWFGKCDCPANNPPADDRTGIVKWHPIPCYHLAAVLIFFVRTANATAARQRTK